MQWLVIFEHNLEKQDANRIHILEFCRALSKIDKVTLISYTDETNIDSKSKFSCIKVNPAVFWPSSCAYIFNTIKTFFYLLRVHRVRKVDVVDVVYVRATAFGLGPLLFARWVKVPSVLEINGAWHEELKLALKRFPVWKRLVHTVPVFLRGLSIDIGCRLADKVIAVTPELSFYLQARGVKRDRIAVISNGVNVQQFVPLDKDECKRALELDRNLRYIGFVGNLAPWQGLEYLIEAFAQIVKDYSPRCRLLIVGDGVERRHLISLSRNLGVEGSVIFTGSRPYNQVPQYMGACDVLAVPKKPFVSGYSPLKVYEYMACGRPILASAVEGLGLIEEREIGVLFEPGNVADLADKLRKLLDASEEHRREMGRRARQIAVNEFSWDITVSRVRDVAKALS